MTDASLSESELEFPDGESAVTTTELESEAEHEDISFPKCAFGVGDLPTQNSEDEGETEAPKQDRRSGTQGAKQKLLQKIEGESSFETSPGSWTEDEAFPDDRKDLMNWHPNRVRVAVAQAVLGCLRSPQRVKFTEKKLDIYGALKDITAQNGAGQKLRASAGKRTRGRNLYFKVMGHLTGEPIRTLRKVLTPKWSQCQREDRDEWVLLDKVFYDPRLKGLDEISKDFRDEKYHETESKEGNGKKQKERKQHKGYGFTLSYNTSLGFDHPDVIKVVQSGKVGEALYKALRAIPVFQEAFSELWEFANKLAMKHKLPTVNVAMEHSQHGDHEARVHFHVFLGLELRGGVGFGRVPFVIEIDELEFRWRGITPHVKPSMPQRKSWNVIYQALASGSYYVAGPKYGGIMKRSTSEPIQD